MKMEFMDLRVHDQHLRMDIAARMQAVVDHGQFIMGPEVRELEKSLERFTGSTHCVTVASGTEALLISLMALGIGPGDEVITTPFTFAATVETIVLLGATPVLVDVEPDTCNIASAEIEAAVTAKTRAIMPVSLYGQPPDMSEINEIAARHGGIPVVEDAAQSFGATYQGRKSCALSTIGCTSFFPSKPLGCYGDGGAIFTDDAGLAQAMREIRVHGQEKRYFHTRVGVGGRMDTLQCAVLLGKLPQFEHDIASRIVAGAQYIELLEAVPSVTPIKVRSDRSCVWGQFTVLVKDRDEVVRKLKDEGIPTAVHYPTPLHNQPAYRDRCRARGQLEHASFVAERVLSLPMYPRIDRAKQETVVSALRRATS